MTISANIAAAAGSNRPNTPTTFVSLEEDCEVDPPNEDLSLATTAEALSICEREPEIEAAAASDERTVRSADIAKIESQSPESDHAS